MKVRELIDKLKRMPQESEAVIELIDEDGVVEEYSLDAGIGGETVQ